MTTDADTVPTPDPLSGKWQLFDGDHDLENAWYDTFAAALQGARSSRWRGHAWIIFAPDNQGAGIIRRYDSGEEFLYWREMKERGSTNIGSIPLID